MDWSWLLAVWLVSLQQGSYASQILKTFPSESGVTLRNLVYSSVTNELFVGGVNRIYKLDDNLSLKTSLTTGPREDSVQCPPNPSDSCCTGSDTQTCSVVRKRSNATTMALAIDTSNNKLIACSDLYYGSCHKVDMSSLRIVERVFVPVVSNDPDLLPIIFISDGMDGEGNLYVASPRSHLGMDQYTRRVPLLATRSLSSFEYARDASFKDLRNTDNYEYFEVLYKYAFDYKGYNYFMSVQRESLTSRVLVTKISRVCQLDEYYNSYIEIPLSCSSSNTGYNVLTSAYLGKPGSILARMTGAKTTDSVIFATFTKDGDPSKSAVCIYPMPVVMRAFLSALQRCFSGNNVVVKVGPEHLVQPQQCTAMSVDVTGKYCGTVSSNNPIEGKTDLSHFALYRINGEFLTAIRVKAIDIHTVIYLGTESGKILKLVPETLSSGRVYQEYPLNSGPVLPHGMKFDKTMDSLYVLTANKVLKVLVSECDKHVSCESCLGAGDPHCGWCFSQNMCTDQDECPDSENFSWFDYSATCPSVSTIDPGQISFSSFQQTAISLILPLFPNNVEEGVVKCVLKGSHPPQEVPAKAQTWNSNGKASGTEVLCENFKAISALPDGKDHVELDLEIRVMNSPWASTVVMVYDCGRLSSCTDCANTTMPCDWCVEHHSCSAKDPPSCAGGIVITSGKKPRTRLATGFTTLYGLEMCPQIDNLPSISEIKAPSGVAKSFTVRAFNLQSVHTEMQCRYSTPSQTIVTTAELRDVSVNVKDVICKERVLSYLRDSPFEKFPLDVMWDGHPIDNPSNIQIVVYKCSQLASNCGHCLLLDPSYDCGWCENGCSMQRDCPTGLLERNATCPDPQITSFSPRGGPVNGGTILTIQGTNLGKTVSDIKNSVNVAGVLCSVNASMYIAPETVVCKTGPASAAHNGTITIRVKDKFTANSPTKFIYADPIVTGFKPKQGPMSGGTNVTIFGHQLDLGSNFTVSMNNVRLQILEKHENRLVVRTPPQDRNYLRPISLLLDNSEENLLSPSFQFREDPDIDDVQPELAILSGGNILTVIGKNLDIIQKPYIQVTVPDGQQRQALCETLLASRMHCPTPDLSEYANVPTPGRAKRDFQYNPFVPSFPMKVRYGFVMDGVETLLNLPGDSQLTYYEDPYFFPFSGADRTKPYSKDMDLEISGEKLLVFEIFNKEAIILVGGVSCPVTRVDKVRIICKPPTSPRIMDNGLATVVAKLGNVKTELGKLNYAAGANVSTALILGIVLGLLLPLVIIAIIIFICWRRRNSRKNRNKVVMPPPNSVPNNYQQNRGSAELDGAAAEEAIPLKANEEGYLDDAPIGEKTNWADLLNRIENPKIRKAVADVMISKDRLELGELIGKGHFSCVYAGTLLDESYENPSKVAIKTLQSNDFDRHSVENFLKEGVIMKNFRHAHVLQLLGVVVGPSNEPMVVLPFMANGDLRSYVKDKKKNFTARQLLGLAQQVAEGMAYLSSLNCVHRDLAARNCMIDEENIVRVADFGLTRDLYERDYYSSKDRKAKLPIKWMALESLEDFVFTNRTDVWSYGVLMWELMTRGVTPYPDVDVFDIRTYLASGRRLRKPKYCPDNVYKIMLDCWHEIPERRPNFADLVNRLEILLNPPKKRQPSTEPATSEPMYMNISKSDSVEYLNPVSPPAET